MQRVYMAVRLPNGDGNVTIEVPENRFFERFEDAFFCFLALIKEDDVFFEMEQPRRAAPLEHFTGRHLVQLWIADVPDFNPERFLHYGI